MEPRDPTPARKFWSAIAVVAFCIIIWLLIQKISAPPPPPKRAMPEMQPGK
jgi:hypothetical protein